MSVSDQEHVLTVIASLLKRKGAGRWIAGLLAMPIVIGSCVALFGYLFIGVQFLRDVNIARVNYPAISAAISQTRDSLNIKEGYHFQPISLQR